MKTIGLIGGMSWASSLEYYRIINEDVKKRLGGLHSAQSLMFSFDFADIETLQTQGQWDEATSRLVAAAQSLERGGADLVVICTNTMHKMAADVQAAISIPLLHIADPTAGAIKARGLTTVGLLGTRYTMEQEFYRGRLGNLGLEVVIPEEGERQSIHDIIYNELVLGIVRPESRVRYLDIIDHLSERGAEGIILGCTEIGLLVNQHDTDLPLFDTTLLHAHAAVSMALPPS